jgi:hypothetical protein
MDMSTNAKDLLSIVSARLSMQEAGTIRPHPSVAEANRQLIQKLQTLSPEESIDISYAVEPFRAKYIRVATGELLAEITDTPGR